MGRERSERNGIGSILARYRKKKRWTQTRLSQEAGVPVTAIRRLEQLEQIQLTQLHKIVSVLGARLEIAPEAASASTGLVRKEQSLGGLGLSNLEADQAAQGTVSSNHSKHEVRSLVMHQIIDELYKKSPQRVIEHGLGNIIRWRENGVDCEDLRTWESVLKKYPKRLSAILNGTDETSIRLRQSSPFPGLISQKQRQKIFEMHQ